MISHDSEIRKVQGLTRAASFSVVLPKRFAHNLNIGKGDFVRILQEDKRIVIEKLAEESRRK